MTTEDQLLRVTFCRFACFCRDVEGNNNSSNDSGPRKLYEFDNSEGVFAVLILLPSVTGFREDALVCPDAVEGVRRVEFASFLRRGCAQRKRWKISRAPLIRARNCSQ